MSRRNTYSNHTAIDTLLKLWGNWAYSRVGTEYPTSSAGIAGADVFSRRFSVLEISDDVALKVDAIICALKKRDEEHYEIVRRVYLKRESYKEIAKALHRDPRRIHEDLKLIKSYVMGAADVENLPFYFK